MAIRYSGDMEVRLSFVEGHYQAKLRSPGFRAQGSLSAREVGLTRKQGSSTPEAYDQAALAFLKLAVRMAPALRRVLVIEGDIVIRRTFQAPCPVRIKKGGRFGF